MSEHKPYSNWLLSLPFHLLPPTPATSSLGHQGQEVWSGVSEHVLHLTSDELPSSHHILHCMKPEASPKHSLQAHFHVCLQRLLSSLHKVGAGLATEPLIAAGPDSACLCLQGILSHIEKCAGLGPLQPPAPHAGARTGWEWGIGGWAGGDLAFLGCCPQSSDPTGVRTLALHAIRVWHVMKRDS